jgi:hypothetical protein
MKKQLLLFSFMLTIVCCNNINATVDANMFYDETDEKAQWEVIEAAFITNPARAKQLCWRHIESIVPGIVCSIAAYKTLEVYDALPFTSEKVTKETKNFGIFEIGNPKIYSPLILVTSGAVLTYNYAQCYLEHQANRDAIQNFFANYDDNQYFVPASLQDAFDTIAERIELEGMDEVLVDANDYVDIINDIVMRHFESRYKSVLDAKGRSALTEAKTFTEVFRNFFDGVHKIK